MPRWTLVFVSLVAVAGCKEVNPGYCSSGLHPDDPVCADAGGAACKGNADCKDPGLLLCNTNAPGGGVCVECLLSSDCKVAMKPVCGSNNACGPCTKHSDCAASNVCLPDGSCAVATNVAYVDGTNGVMGAACTKEAPCMLLPEALDKKSVVKVSGILTVATDLANRNGATILADPGAKLAPANNGIALDVKNGSRVSIFDLEITRAMGSQPGLSVSSDSRVELTRVTLSENSADGARVAGQLTCTQCAILKNAAVGLNVTDGSLTLVRSTVRGNTNGGISVTNSGTKFQIVSNVIYGNGSGGLIGGIYISVDGDAGNVLDFNSISRNRAGATPGGIQCTAASTSLTASHNIIWDNIGGVQPQVTGVGCTFASSHIGPGGVSVDPQFMDIDTGDLHLRPTSPVRGQAVGADLSGLAAKDIDGDPRVAPADLGADQTK